MPDNDSIRILFIGDIVGKPGRKALTAALPSIQQKHAPDVTIANAENIAHGLGVTQKTLDECRHAGIDFFTSGNHIWKKPNVLELFHDDEIPLIRPANYPEDAKGKGYKTVMVGEKKLLVINLNGQVFIEDKFSSPFTAIDKILKKEDISDYAGIIIDFHAEATSEKVAFGWYVDGRVSAVLGTHTHIQTADEKVLPKGTGYISDVGMTGLKESVIGIDKDIILNNFTQEKTIAHDIPDHGQCIINAVLVDIDASNQQTTSIERVYHEVEV